MCVRVHLSVGIVAQRVFLNGRIKPHCAGGSPMLTFMQVPVAREPQQWLQSPSLPQPLYWQQPLHWQQQQPLPWQQPQQPSHWQQPPHWQQPLYCHTPGADQGQGKGKGKHEELGKDKGKGQGLCSGAGKGKEKGNLLRRGKGSSSSSGEEGQGKGPSSSPGEVGQGKGKGKWGKPWRRLLSEDEKKAKRKRQAERIKLSNRANVLTKGEFRVPWFHRRGHLQPGKIRKATQNFVLKWKKHMEEDAAWWNTAKHDYLWSRDSKEEERAFQVELAKMRKHMREEVFDHVGLKDARIIQDVTGTGRYKLEHTPLWPGGPAWGDLSGDARPNWPVSDMRVWDLWLTDYHPNFWEHLFKDDPLNAIKGRASSSSGYQASAPSGQASGPAGQASGPAGQAISWLRLHGTVTQASQGFV